MCEWVSSENIVYENPYQIYDESGWEMNYIDSIGFYEEFENDFLEQKAFEQAYRMNSKDGSCQHFVCDDGSKGPPE